MMKCILAFFLSIQLAFASGTTKLVDMVLSSTGTSQILTRHGIKQSDAGLVENYLATALASLGSKRSLSRAEFLDVLSKLPLTAQDATIRKELQVVLDKSEGKLLKEDVVRAVNHIIYLANRYGKSVVITCSECVNENLAKEGFKFTIANIKNSSTKKLLNDVIPGNPADLQNFISSRVKRLGLGDYSRVSPQIVSPSEEKSFALFLALMENGSPEFKKLAQAIKNISTKNGKTNLIDLQRPNKFWKVAINDMSSLEMATWTKTLNEVSVLAEKEKISPEEAFYKILKERTRGSETLMSRFKAVKQKRCFFK